MAFGLQIRKSGERAMLGHLTENGQQQTENHLLFELQDIGRVNEDRK